MWVQLLAAKTVDVHGEIRKFNSGDWVDVGKQTALAWIANHEARVLDIGKIKLVPDGGGILITANEEAGRTALAMGGNLPIQTGDLRLPWDRTMIWDAQKKIRIELIPVGFHLLKTWEIAVPLVDYKTLALNLGTPEERTTTQAIIKDLRVPVYDPRLIFARKCENVEQLLQVWGEERSQARDGRLSFLRSLYKVKPLILALPTSWGGGGPPLERHYEIP